MGKIVFTEVPKIKSSLKLDPQKHIASNVEFTLEEPIFFESIPNNRLMIIEFASSTIVRNENGVLGVKGIEFVRTDLNGF